ncbi:MAG: DEAD/DEAH box helicase [Firmicutes bacterium]|nr:DEAD/DEAH box helicase [Bacillota bacterium]
MPTNTINICVTNTAPKPAERIPSRSLALFQAYASKEYGQALCPFEHQASVFERIEKDQEVRLIAGTASGKTLAVAVPLFAKLKASEIRHALFMYPTVALLEDQRRVMDSLAEISGLEAGELRGGMSRSRLIAALIKPVILATPDEIYWFFRRNIKYSGLLIYGLCQVDEFVLDEAHLFNGLMLRNFEHLWKRIRFLAGNLGKSPRLHILTATPTEGLERLNDAHPIVGKSKCGDVQVEFRVSGRRERAQDLAHTVDEALVEGGKKVLVVCNSARTAHQLFEKYKVEDTAAIPVQHKLRFGKLPLGALSAWLDRIGADRQLMNELGQRLFKEEDVVLADVPGGTHLEVPLQDLVAHAMEALERQCWRIKRALWERAQRPGETCESLLNNRPLPCRIIAVVRRELEAATDIKEQQTIIDQWLADTGDKISGIQQDPIHCEAPEFKELGDAFVSVGIDKNLAFLMVKRLVLEMKADPAQVPVRGMSHRPVYLRWLDQAVGTEAAEAIRRAAAQGLQSGELDVECRHIGVWKDAGIPVIVYSGSMAKQARTGLIDVFRDLEQAVLISTSAVEVGVDFYADTLITEECESSSFLQRFGRVGRHEDASKVITLVDGDSYSILSPLDGTSMDRERFSSKIREVFPQRNYTDGSQLLDASHYLVNEQLGRTGRRLNEMAEFLKVRPIAEKVRAADIELSFGLRGTMPQIALRDGVAKDAFYLLRYINDEDLRPSDSPFLAARAKTWFTSLIFKPASSDILVDLEETLKASKYLFVLEGSNVCVLSQPAVGWTYLEKMLAYFGRVGAWNKTHPGNFMLLYGDVYLSRVDREIQDLMPVRNSDQDPVFIPNQTYLFLFGWTNADETRRLLEETRVADWEELYYDWNQLKYASGAGMPGGMVILENATGACFAAYRELVNHVGRKV